MWTEKYRPKTFDEITNQEQTIRGIRSLVRNPAEIPHLLLAGPAGTGKTTVALIIAREALGKLWRENTLEMNASDERKLEDVRQKVKSFARHIGLGVPFRFIILDEADEMTPAAQTALRRIMEENSATTRFILTCNYSSNIIEPIQSRCAIFRFTRLNSGDVIAYLKHICESERVRCDEGALKTIHEASLGDLRHAINLLQATSSLGSATVANVKAVEGTTHRAKIGEMIEQALGGDFHSARSKLIELLSVYGIPERDITRYANQELFNKNLEDPARAARILAKYDARLTAGSSPDIQLSAMLAELSTLRIIPAREKPHRRKG